MDGELATRIDDAFTTDWREDAPARAASRTSGFAAVINVSSSRLSRRKREHLVAKLRARFGAALNTVAYADGECLGDVLRHLARSQPRAVIVAGGDGTARTALEVLTPLNIPVAPLPAGTLNRISKLVFGGARLEAALDQIATGQARWIAGGRIGKRRFFCAAGLGEAMRLYALREHVRRGAWREALAVWREVTPHLFSNSITAGAFGRSVDCAVIGVGPVDAAFGLRPPAPRTHLEIATASWRGLAHMISLAPSVLMGGWRTVDGVVASPADSAQFDRTDGAIPALLDGEFTMLHGPVMVRYHAHAGLVWTATESAR